jgi:hypothetical protein
LDKVGPFYFHSKTKQKIERFRSISSDSTKHRTKPFNFRIWDEVVPFHQINYNYNYISETQL